MTKRRRFQQSESFQDRLEAVRAGNAREEAAKLPPGNRAADDILRKARQADTASHLDDWANSPELRAADMKLIQV